jgi:hypothetical protein
MPASSSSQPSILGTEFMPIYANLIRQPSTLPPPGQGGGTGRVIVAETPPAAAREGQLLWQPSRNAMFIFFAQAWAQIW